MASLADEINLTLAVEKLDEALELASKCSTDNAEATELIKGLQSTVAAMLRLHLEPTT